MGILMMVLFNAVAFYFIAKVLPGFRIKDEKTALIISGSYSFLMILGGLLVLPLVAIVTIGLSIIAIIPLIGPLLAGSGLLVTTFLVVFGLSAIMLIVIDKMLEDFEMDSLPTALIASFLLAVGNVFLRAFLG